MPVHVMFGYLLMMAMHRLLSFGSDKNAIGTFGVSVPLATLKMDGSLDGGWFGGPQGTETCVFGGRLETVWHVEIFLSMHRR